MKKTLLKGFIAGIFLMFSATAYSQVDWEAIKGAYKFTSTFELVDMRYDGVFAAESDCALGESTKNSLSGFLGFNEWPSALVEMGAAYFNLNCEIIKVEDGVYKGRETVNTLGVNSAQIANGALCFANPQGENPFLTFPDFTNVWRWTIESDGTITIPDFTIVDSSNSYNLVARYSNAKLTPVAQGEVDNANFAGVYTVSGYYYDYDSKDYYDASFIMEINEENQLVRFANYDLSALIEQGYPIYGTIDGNSFTFTSPSGFYLMETPAMILGGNPWDSEYSDEGIVFTISGEEYDLTDFSIWSLDDATKTKKLSWIVESVVLGEVEGPGQEEPGEDSLPYVGVYTVSGTKISYLNGVAGSPEDAKFTMIIVEDEDGDYGLTRFAGYEVPDDSGYPGIYAWEGDEPNIVEFYAAQNTSLNEDGNIIIGGDNISEYESFFLGITFDEPTSGSIMDFTVWDAEIGEWGEVESATIIASWTNLTFEAVDSGVDNIEMDKNAPVIYYNLQGVKISNPEKGLFIKKQGNKSSKVIIK